MVPRGKAARLIFMADGPDNIPDTILGTPAGVGAEDAMRIALRRDRLLAALTLIAGVGLAVALPFALKTGAEFFLPLTVALVIAVALVPALEWLERHRVPSPLAALSCVILFLIAANIAIAAIVIPATDFFRLLPRRIDRIQNNLAPLLDLYSSLEAYVNRTLRQIASAPVKQTTTTAVAPPNTILEFAASTAPHGDRAVHLLRAGGLLLPCRLDPVAQAHDHRAGRASTARWRPRG